MRCRCTTRWFFRCVGFLRRPCKRDFTILLFDTYIYAYIYYMHISPRAEADMAMREEGSEHQEEAKPIPPHPTSGEHQTRELIMPQPPRRRPPRGPEAHDLAPTLAAGVADPQDHSEVGSWSWGNVVGATVPVSCGGGALDPSPRFLLSRPGPLGVSTASVLPSMYCTYFTASTADNPIGQSPPFHSISLPPPLSIYTTLSSPIPGSSVQPLCIWCISHLVTSPSRSSPQIHITRLLPHTLFASHGGFSCRHPSTLRSRSSRRHFKLM